MRDATGWVSFARFGSDEPPRLEAWITGGPDPDATRGFGALPRALSWARRRADRVVLSVHDDRWSAGSTPADGLPELTADAEATAGSDVARGFAAARAERHRYDDEQRWYIALDDPPRHGEDQARLDAIRAVGHVADVTVRRTRRDTTAWVIDVLATSRRIVWHRVLPEVADTFWNQGQADAAARGTAPGTLLSFDSGLTPHIGLREFEDQCPLFRTSRIGARRAQH